MQVTAYSISDGLHTNPDDNDNGLAKYEGAAVDRRMASSINPPPPACQGCWASRVMRPNSRLVEVEGSRTISQRPCAFRF